MLLPSRRSMKTRLIRLNNVTFYEVKIEGLGVHCTSQYPCWLTQAKWTWTELPSTEIWFDSVLRDVFIKRSLMHPNGCWFLISIAFWVFFPPEWSLAALKTFIFIHHEKYQVGCYSPVWFALWHLTMTAWASVQSASREWLCFTSLFLTGILWLYWWFHCTFPDVYSMLPGLGINYMISSAPSKTRAF